MSNKRLILIAFLCLAGLAVLAILPFFLLEPEPAGGVAAAPISLPFRYEFRTAGTLEETATSDLTSSPYFWVNSGGQMWLRNGEGSTVLGEMPSTSRWHRLYSQSNPVDTDGGTHPQNIFRLFTRQPFGDVRQEAYFMIDKYNVSSSPNRAESNGILFFNRAQDNDNLYYAGLRVDGNAVIKKKKNGIYYTLNQQQAFTGGTYDRSSNPILMPVGTWIGLRTEVTNGIGGTVKITLYTDICRTGTWKKAAEATDNGLLYGGTAFTADGRGGIRTDFMDVRFDDYSLSTVSGGGILSLPASPETMSRAPISTP